MLMVDIPIPSQESLKSLLEMQKSWENSSNSSKTIIGVFETVVKTCGNIIYFLGKSFIWVIQISLKLMFSEL